MLLRYFYDKALSQASYLLGSPETGEALVIDPARDAAPYLAAAREEGLTITQVAETHIHADFVSGRRELVAQSGARPYLSGLGGADWSYHTGDDAVFLRDGDSWWLGALRIDAIHTPGHSPEHLVFRVTDTAASDQPVGLFTGDCLLVGGVGRPDLVEQAEQGARDQFRSVQRFIAMPDFLQVWPGHGAGSACGNARGGMPSSTLGYEKRVNPAFRFEDAPSFSAWLLAAQPEIPPYFAHVKRMNQRDVPLIASLEKPLPMEGFILAELLKGTALVIDARTDGAHVPGALHINPRVQFSTYAGWFVSYEVPVYLVAAPEDVDRLLGSLRGIGIDNLPGYFTPEEAGDLNTDLPDIALDEAVSRIEAGALVLDVRSQREYAEGHISGSTNIPYGLLPQRLDSLPKDREIVVVCASGTRSCIAASLLAAVGFTHFASLIGGLDAWKAAGLPLV
jgi:hydroxyacylglutathione hydrolase